MINISYLTPHVRLLLFGIFLALGLATLLVPAVAKDRSSPTYKELRSRIKSWWMIVGMLTAAILLNRGATVLLFAFVSFLGLKEYLSLTTLRKSDRAVLFLAYLSVPVQYYLAYINWYNMFIIFVPVYLFLLFPIRMVLSGKTHGFLKAVSILQWGVMLNVFSISHIAYLLDLPEDKNPAGAGVGLLLYLVFLTELNDVAQYIWGKTLGKKKIIPQVSPNKTVEGFLGGVITTVAMAIALAPLLTPISRKGALFFGLLIALGGFFGDISVSAIKRDLGVKDSGNILPGHGGILDRIDSLIFTSPIFFHALVYLHY